MQSKREMATIMTTTSFEWSSRVVLVQEAVDEVVARVDPLPEDLNTEFLSRVGQ